MGKIYVKGGAWSNHEDATLKVGVLKYGLNAWDRVGTLLPRKNAALAKARWEEWLDPRLNKGPWTKAEEEKLLKLADLWPGQWRTIAEQIPGRTPKQCADKFNEVFLAATGSTTAIVSTDYLEEGKEAKGDAVNMDEHDKQMLDDARGRASNVAGKKQLRAERATQLRETRLMSSLQKARELRAAGVELKKGPLNRWKQKLDIERRVRDHFEDDADGSDDGDDFEPIDTDRLRARKRPREDDVDEKALATKITLQNELGVKELPKLPSDLLSFKATMRSAPTAVAPPPSQRVLKVLATISSNARINNGINLPKVVEQWASHIQQYRTFRQRTPQAVLRSNAAADRRAAARTSFNDDREANLLVLREELCALTEEERQQVAEELRNEFHQPSNVDPRTAQEWISAETAGNAPNPIVGSLDVLSSTTASVAQKWKEWDRIVDLLVTLGEEAPAPTSSQHDLPSLVHEAEAKTATSASKLQVQRMAKGVYEGAWKREGVEIQRRLSS